MTERRTCPQCGASLDAVPPTAPCPACLLRLGLSDLLHGDSESADESSRAAIPEPLRSRFPEFEWLRVLGEGGMGTVYLARHLALDRLVAIKVIKDALAADPGFAERFSREARTLARLNHPQIVAVHDFGQRDGVCFLVMEYVDGPSLRERLHSKQVTLEQALAIIPQICEALQYAHDQGVVHRDIKPENILLDAQGRVKIADFGLAKMAATEEATPSLTLTRQVVGTPQYMAPEQLYGAKSVDRRADIYSPGVIFYEMLTGELPLGRFEPPSHHSPVDVRWDSIVMRTLERDPDRRYQHASQVQTDVESLAAAGPSSSGRREPSSAPSPATSAPSRSSQPKVKGNEELLREKDLFAAGVMLLLLGVAQAGFGVTFAWMILDRSLSSSSLSVLGALATGLGVLLGVGVGIFLMVCGILALTSANDRAARLGGLILILPISPLWFVNVIVGIIILRFIRVEPRERPVNRESPAYASTMTLPAPGRRRFGTAALVGLAAALLVAFLAWRHFASGRLVAAVQRADAEAVRAWGTWGATADATDANQSPALFLAAQAGDRATVDMLLRLGAPVDGQTRGGDTPLMAAAFAGHHNVCLQLLESSAEVNRRNLDGMTPLLYAVRGGHAEIVTKLIESGAALNVADANGVTPLHWAAVEGRLTIVDKLLARGAEVDVVAQDGDTPLLKAAWKGHASVIQRLTAAKASVDRVNSHGETALMLAAAYGNLDGFKVLLEQGADSRAAAKSGVTPFTVAAAKGHVAIVDLLLAKNAPDPQGTEAQSAIMLAAASGHDAVVERLKAAGIAEPPINFFRRAYLLAQDGQPSAALPLFQKVLDSLETDPSEWRIVDDEWTYAFARPRRLSRLYVAECQRLAGDLAAAGETLREVEKHLTPEEDRIPVVSKWKQSESDSVHRSYAVTRATLSKHATTPQQDWEATVQYQDVNRRSFGATRSQSGSESVRLPNLFP